MDTLARDILARLRWRTFVAKGVLLGLLASASAAIVLLLMQPDVWRMQWPGLAGTRYWAYLGLGALTMGSLLMALGGHRHARRALVAVALAVLGFEALVMGPGPHLLRVPFATLLAFWASGVIRPRQ